MALPELAISGISVVIRGSYNPTIFSPDWLFSRKLIGQTELDAAEVSIISPGITTFTTDWLRVNATPDSCILGTTDPLQFERARDATLGVLIALQSIPIGAMGINREVHFQVSNFEKWHAIGDALAPKGIWDEVLHLPGLLDITMLGVRTDKYRGRMQAQVQPSSQVERGLFVSINDHFELAYTDTQPQDRDGLLLATEMPPNKLEKVPIAIEVLSEEWENSMDRADKIIERIAQLGG